MAIQIIDNFNLSVAKPIDDRFVVGSQSFYTDKNDIPYKYSGLRVWDLNDGVPYYWDGSSWISENSVSISGSGNANYVPKFIGSGSSTVLDDSCIYVSGLNVGINTGSSITTGYNLDVNGGIISQGATGFSGVGTLLTNLNATNISTGLMSLSRLTNYTSSGWILTSGASQPIYTNPSTLTVGGASQIQITNDTTTSSPIQYITFVGGYTTTQYSTKVSGASSSESASIRQLTYKPSTGNLTSALMTTGTFSVGSINATSASLIISISSVNKLFVESTYVNFGTYSTGTPRISLSASPSAALPSYTWYGDPDTGMYRSAANTIGFSTNGVERMKINSNGGIQMVDDVVSISASYSISGMTFSSGSNLSLSTFISVAATQSHDRIVYCNTNSSTQYLPNFWAGGIFWAVYEITNGPSTICVKEMAVNDSSRSGISQFNHSFILPAGWSFTMKGYSTSFRTNDGAQYGAIQVKTIRLGLQ